MDVGTGEARLRVLQVEGEHREDANGEVERRQGVEDRLVGGPIGGDGPGGGDGGRRLGGPAAAEQCFDERGVEPGSSRPAAPLR